MSATIVSASDAVYFDLLKGLVLSIREKPDGADIALSILDVGLNSAQSAWLSGQGATIVVPDWDSYCPMLDELVCITHENHRPARQVCTSAPEPARERARQIHRLRLP